MHELSIAQRLVELAEEQLLGERPCRVTVVRVRVGPLSGVVPEALKFAFDEAAAGTMLERSRLEIEPVAPMAHCDTCGHEVLLETVQRLRCPTCGSLTPRVTRGRELELASLEVVDVDAGDSTPPADGDGAAAGGATSAAGGAGGAADRAGPPAGAEEE